MKRILFVCTGNTCRSPLAEQLLKAKSTDLFEVQSAGIMALDGEDASSHVHQVLQEKGLQMEHKAQRMTTELIEWADLILTMTKRHEHYLKEYFPAATRKIFSLKEYVTGSAESGDIADPFGGTVEQYRQTMVELDLLIDQFLKKEQ